MKGHGNLVGQTTRNLYKVQELPYNWEIEKSQIKVTQKYLYIFQYLHTVAAYTDRNDICCEIIDYLCTRQDKHNLDPDISHHLLEVILYKINLSVMVGKLQYAKNILQVSHDLNLIISQLDNSNLSVMVGKLHSCSNVSPEFTVTHAAVV